MTEPAADTWRVRLRIEGRVQGVWFRGAVRERALALGVHGWVRNSADGSVEAVAEGGRRAVTELVAFCRRGPPLARVTAVAVNEEPPEGVAGFEVRH